jgi:hypothetical protein
MDKNSFANRFGLAISFVFLSLFPTASAWAQRSTTMTASAQGTQQVVVSNTPAQPVPMVGLIKDSDASARKPYQWEGYINENGSDTKIMTVPNSQRLVIEQVSGFCNAAGRLAMVSEGSATHYEFLPRAFTDGTNDNAASSVRFYISPGDSLYLEASPYANNNPYSCQLSVTGYFVDLQ